jgi:hypothetical protein
MNDVTLDFVEVARKPHALVEGEELVRCVARPYGDVPDAHVWWAIKGPEGGVQFMEIHPPEGMRSLGLSGDFGVHYRDDMHGEDCPLIGRCQFSCNGWVGSQIVEQLQRHDPNGENPQMHESVVWGTLTALYYGYLCPGESVEAE